MALKLDDRVLLEGEIIEFKKTGRKTLYTIRLITRKRPIEKSEWDKNTTDVDVYDTEFKKARKRKAKTQ